MRKDGTHGIRERMVGMDMIYRLLDKSVRMNITVGSWAVRLDVPYSKDEQDSRVEGEHFENGQMNMSFRLTDIRVRMDKTHGLRKSTVKMDK